MVDIHRKVVNTDGVDTKLLHQNGIPEAGIRICQRIRSSIKARGTTRLVTAEFIRFVEK